VIETAEYQQINAREPALGFLRWTHLCPDATARGEAFLQAAWAADDASMEAEATAWRRAAAEAWGQPTDPELALRMLDVLRRAALFDEVVLMAQRLGQLDVSSSGIVAFQLARVSERDTGRHLMSSALRPPAHRPHVAHQAKPEKRGFWRLITGRG
jgi:hypothetical protein